MTSVTGNMLSYDKTLQALFDISNSSAGDNNINNIINPFIYQCEYISNLKQELLEDSFRSGFDSENSLLSWSDKSCQDLLNVDLLDWTYNIDSTHNREMNGDDFRANQCNIPEFIRDYNLDINDEQVKDSLDYEYFFDPPTLPNISSFINPCDDLSNSLHFTPPPTPSILHSSESAPNTPIKSFSDKKSLKVDVKSHFNGAEKKHFVKRPKKTKATHLWKFMRSLLDDPAYNPSFIKWENKDKGVFRIVPGQSKNIARLWGLKKNNPTMTFDKLSRSLRWCREYGFLSKVPSNEGFPKKLCFRFGDRAMDWNGN